MVYKIINEQKNSPNGLDEKPTEKPKEPGLIQQGLEFAEGVGHSAATAATEAASTISGLPGDFFGVINDWIAGPIASLITGQQPVSYEETPIGKIWQPSEKIKQKYQKDFPYLKERNEYEQKTNTILKTIIQLLAPGSQAQRGRIIGTSASTRAFFKSVGAEMAKEGVQDWTGDQEKGDLAKFGTLVTLSLLDRPSATNHVSNLYRELDRYLDSSGMGQTRVSAPQLQQYLTNLRNRVSQGTLAPSEQAIATQVDRALDHFQGNEITIDNLRGISRSLNEHLTDVYQSLGRGGAPRARQLFGNMLREVNNELDQFGQANPQFGQLFSEAQQAHGAMQQSKVISNFAEKALNFSPQNKGLLYLMGGSGGVGSLATGITPATAIGVPAIYQTGKIFYRINRSPSLRRYYTQALSAAAREDVRSFNTYMKKLDNELTKEEKSKPPYKIIKE